MFSSSAERILLGVGLILITAEAGATDPWPQAPAFSDFLRSGDPPYAPFGGASVVHQRCQGGATTLEITQTRATMPQHDVDLGQSSLVLKDAAGQVLVQTRAAELWDCLGYRASTHRYVITSTHEHGVKVSLRGLVYLDEAARRFVDSAVSRRGMEAVVAELAPGGRYFVLVGAVAQVRTGEGRGPGMFVLDLDQDGLRYLGVPPAPPPLPPEGWAERGMLYAWDAPERHFGPLDPGIFSFVDEHTLHVSYGRDSHRARARSRRVRSFELAAPAPAQHGAAGTGL